MSIVAARLCSVAPRAPVIAAWGAGVDSTAMIIELVARGEAPDVVLMAQTRSERPETDAFVSIFQRWMGAHGIENHLVCYQVRHFKHWPPYDGLLENLLTNATLPSIAFNRSSCSIKWKITPQDQWTANWAPAREAWQRGQKVIRLIGYDCSAADDRRYAHREGHVSDRFDYRYPLREWGWDREACIARIRSEGLPVPVKSSCFFCSAMRPEEVATLPAAYLRLIVLMEARAAPRLRAIQGLWRNGVQGRRGATPRPATMTAFIRSRGLLTSEEIDHVIATAPTELVAFQEAAAALPLEVRPVLATWLERFRAGIESIAA